MLLNELWNSKWSLANEIEMNIWYFKQKLHNIKIHVEKNQLIENKNELG